MIIIGEKLFPLRNNRPKSLNLHTLILICRSYKIARQTSLEIKFIYYIHVCFIRILFIRNQNGATDWWLCSSSIHAQRVLKRAIRAWAAYNYASIFIYVHYHLKNEVSWRKSCFALCFWIEYISVGSNFFQILRLVIIDIPFLLEGSVAHASPYINSWPINRTLPSTDRQPSNGFLCVYQ